MALAELLLARGAKINTVSDDGMTPFMMAAARESFTPESLQ